MGSNYCGSNIPIVGAPVAAVKVGALVGVNEGAKLGVNDGANDGATLGELVITLVGAVLGGGAGEEEYVIGHVYRGSSILFVPSECQKYMELATSIASEHVSE